MGLNFSRLLRDDDLVEHFLMEVLQVDHEITPETIRRIVTTEKMLIDFKEEEDTLVSTKYRDRNCVSERDRWKLRKQIIHELFTLQRMDKEDETMLGIGGALPRSDIKKEKKAYILIGPPASGKSTLANKIAEKEGAIILDSDLAKRKFPELAYECGASFVQQESNSIIYGLKRNGIYHFDGLLELASSSMYNIVIPRVGQEPDSIIDLAQTLTESHYEVHLTLMHLKRREATIRALDRFNETNRYVPLGYVFDHIANDPLLCYYLLKERGHKYFRSFGIISTDEDVQRSQMEIGLHEENPASWYWE